MTRSLERIADAEFQYPVRFAFKCDGEQIPLRIINYSFNGACFKFHNPEQQKLLKDAEKNLRLIFYIGNKMVREEIPFRVIWADLEESGAFGLHFNNPTTEWAERHIRFKTHDRMRPSLSCRDPLDPNRLIFFQVQDVSSTGLLLCTSLSNKHLFPGMLLKETTLNIPGMKALTLSLAIENTRMGQEEGMFFLGTSLQDPQSEVLKSFRIYLASLSPMKDLESEQKKDFHAGRHLGKHLKSALTFKNITEEKDYEDVLKLRFLAYGKHGKIKSGQSWRDQGDGLANEGMILGAYLGSRLVGSMEMRFGDTGKGFRFLHPDNPSVWSKLNPTRTVEVNKLSVDPKFQGSDIVLGMIQKVHMMVSVRGGFDVILCATDKLVALYKRIGAEDLRYKVQHPHLENIGLNVMCVRRETYMGLQAFNPYAWSVVYGSVHQAMFEVGMAQNSLNRGLRWLMFFKDKIVSLLKGSGETSNARQTSNARKKFIDPRWTRQDMVTTIIYPYIIEMDALHGAEFTNKILDDIGMSREYLQHQSNWLSVGFLDEVLDRYKKMGGSSSELSIRAGICSMKKDVLGLNYYLLKHFVNPEFAFKSFEKIVNRFNKSRTAKLLDCKPTYAKVEIGLAWPEALPKDPAACLNWVSNFESYIGLMTGKKGIVKKTTCCYKGDTACTYHISWSNSRYKMTDAFESFMLVGLPGFSYGLLKSFGSAETTAFGVSVVIFCSLLSLGLWQRFRAKQREIAGIQSEFQSYESESNERYRDLQDAKSKLDHRYRESILLEATSKKIQQTTDFNEILKVSLEAACSMLGFSRAFVMLKDPKKQCLRTSAIVGIKEGVERVWQFEVDISKQRDNGMLLSSVFHSSNPVMIDKVEPHLFQLNAQSQALIRELKTEGFAMVQVPGADGAWGVVVADKTGRKEALSRNDLVLLSRVTQYLGMALDKQAKLDTESLLRRRFQTYVPAAVLNESLEEPQLGGVTRDIVCMFLDIRGFTQMTQKLPPHATLQLLNTFFASAETCISKQGGVIDKFLGDGMLVTWGALSYSADICRPAFIAAQEILKELAQVNEQLKGMGLPQVKIGMGLHYGPAVVGNVGTPSRLEHTIIGPTVNMSSRIEALCKEYSAQIVVSQDFLNRLSATEQKLFKIHEGISIRGFDQKLSIGVFVTEENVLNFDDKLKSQKLKKAG